MGMLDTLKNLADRAAEREKRSVENAALHLADKAGIPVKAPNALEQETRRRQLQPQQMAALAEFGEYDNRDSDRAEDGARREDEADLTMPAVSPASTETEENEEQSPSAPELEPDVVSENSSIRAMQEEQQRINDRIDARAEKWHIPRKLSQAIDRRFFDQNNVTDEQVERPEAPAMNSRSLPENYRDLLPDTTNIMEAPPVEKLDRVSGLINDAMGSFMENRKAQTEPAEQGRSGSSSETRAPVVPEKTEVSALREVEDGTVPTLPIDNGGATIGLGDRGRNYRQMALEASDDLSFDAAPVNVGPNVLGITSSVMTPDATRAAYEEFYSNEPERRASGLSDVGRYLKGDVLDPYLDAVDQTQAALDTAVYQGSNPKYAGYEMPKDQLDDFLSLLENAETADYQSLDEVPESERGSAVPVYAAFINDDGLLQSVPYSGISYAWSQDDGMIHIYRDDTGEAIPGFSFASEQDLDARWLPSKADNLETGDPQESDIIAYSAPLPVELPNGEVVPWSEALDLYGNMSYFVDDELSRDNKAGIMYDIYKNLEKPDLNVVPWTRDVSGVTTFHGSEHWVDDGWDRDALEAPWMTGERYIELRNAGFPGRPVDEIQPNALYSKYLEQTDFGFVPYLVSEEGLDDFTDTSRMLATSKFFDDLANLRNRNTTYTIDVDGEHYTEDEVNRILNGYTNMVKWSDDQPDLVSVGNQGQNSIPVYLFSNGSPVSSQISSVNTDENGNIGYTLDDGSFVLQSESELLNPSQLQSLGVSGIPASAYMDYGGDPITLEDGRTVDLEVADDIVRNFDEYADYGPLDILKPTVQDPFKEGGWVPWIVDMALSSAPYFVPPTAGALSVGNASMGGMGLDYRANEDGSYGLVSANPTDDQRRAAVVGNLAMPWIERLLGIGGMFGTRMKPTSAVIRRAFGDRPAAITASEFPGLSVIDTGLWEGLEEIPSQLNEEYAQYGSDMFKNRLYYEPDEKSGGRSDVLTTNETDYPLADSQGRPIFDDSSNIFDRAANYGKTIPLAFTGGSILGGIMGGGGHVGRLALDMKDPETGEPLRNQYTDWNNRRNQRRDLGYNIDYATDFSTVVPEFSPEMSHYLRYGPVLDEPRPENEEAD